jgi:uncharacterized protein YdcH (DUF465 family)
MFLFQAELREMSQTADEYRHKCEISGEENEALGSQVEQLNNEIKRLETNSDMKNVECQKLKVNIRFVLNFVDLKCFIQKEQVEEMSRTADDYRQKYDISLEGNKNLLAETERLKHEIKRVEAGADMKSVEMQKLKVRI